DCGRSRGRRPVRRRRGRREVPGTWRGDRGGRVIGIASPRGGRARVAGAAIACAVGVGGVWYALNVWRFGNPVAPFVFGARGTLLDADTVRATMDNYGGGRGLLNMFATPVRIFLDPSPYGGAAAAVLPSVLPGRAPRALARRRP